MQNFGDLVSILREQLHATLSRSDVLKPLAWFVGLMILADSIGIALKAPDWYLIGIAITGGIGSVLYLVAYCFCLLNDRDALRSERYSLHKLALERGIVGDNLIGPVADETPIYDKRAEEQKALPR